MAKLKLDKQTVKREILDYFWIVIGLMIYVVAFQGFMMPEPTIVGGGVTGVAQVIYYITGGFVPTGLSYFLINAILLGIAVKVLGPNFGIKTIFAMCMMSLMLSVAPSIFPHETIILEDGREIVRNIPLVQEMFPRAVMAGILIALGVFIAISHGGSTGGTDIVVLMVCKYKDITPGRFLIFLDGSIVLSRLLYNQEIEPLVFGFVIMGVTSYALDAFLAFKSSSAQVFVFTEHYEEVAVALEREMHRGITLIDGQGWYTKKEKKIIMMIVRKTQASQVLRLAKGIDSNAFISVAPLMGVYGKGFDQVKG